jgi:hypothetical protein
MCTYYYVYSMLLLCMYIQQYSMYDIIFMYSIFYITYTYIHYVCCMYIHFVCMYVQCMCNNTYTYCMSYILYVTIHLYNILYTNTIKSIKKIVLKSTTTYCIYYVHTVHTYLYFWWRLDYKVNRTEVEGRCYLHLKTPVVFVYYEKINVYILVDDTWFT